MDLKAALRWTAIYKGISWVVGLIALGLVLAGYWLSLGGIPISLETAIGGAKSPVFVAFALLAFVVWQLGKTLAFYKTTAEAVQAEVAEDFDVELLKSDILSVLDERLAEMQTQIEGTRRSVEELDQSQKAEGDFTLDD